MAIVTPGLISLLRGTIKFLLPSLLSYVICHVLDNLLPVRISTLAKAVIFIATGTLSVWLTVFLDNIKCRREAKNLDTQLTPVWEGRSIANFDILLEIMHDFRVGYPAEPFWPAMAKYGNILNLRIFWIDHIYTIEPEHIKRILAIEFSNYEKGPAFISAANPVLGSGVFNSDGDMWKFHRSITRPFFSKERISHFDIFDRHADEAIALITHRHREGYAVDFQDLVSRFTLDSASEFLFDKCFHLLQESIPYPEYAPEARRSGPFVSCSSSEIFARSFASAQFEVSRRLRLGLTWPLWEIFEDKTKLPMAVVDSFIEPILNEALSKVYEMGDDGKKNIKDVEDDEILLDHLVKLTKDRTVLKDAILNIMLAGRDTTACLMSFAVYMLATHPKFLTRLREEIIAQVGAARRPTYDDIHRMKYLRAVLNETLRLYPPVPLNVRRSLNSTTLPPTTPGGKPWFVPARTSVTYSVFMMHRRTDLWGPDGAVLSLNCHEADQPKLQPVAMLFDPERFIDERLEKYFMKNPTIFLPFNAGPRICLGQQFAYNEASFMLVRLLQAFDRFELDLTAQPVDGLAPESWKRASGRQAEEQLFPKTHLTMYFHKGLWVRMHEAST